MDSNDLKANVLHGEDDLQLLRAFPAESVDLVYLDPPFFSSWAQERSWADRAEMRPFEDDRWQGGVGAYLDWIATPLENLHRILKPTGALFLVCEEAVGHYVGHLLDELSSPPNTHGRMVWWKADSGPAHHYVFYYRKSAYATGRHGHLYTVIHRERAEACSLVAFSFVQGQMKRCISNHRTA